MSPLDPLRGAVLPAVLLALAGPAAGAFAQGFGGTVSDHLVRGDSLLAQGKTAEAIVQFQEARTLCPTPAEAVSALSGEARAKLMQKETLQAVGLLEEAATRFPGDPRASNLLYQAGLAAQSAGEFEKAIGLYRRALETNPTADIVPPLKVQIAYGQRLRGRAGEAIEALKDFEKDYPDHPLLPNALYQLAIATHDLGTGNDDSGELRESEAIYRRLIEKFPGRPAAIEAHFELGLVLSELGRRKEAADFFTQYVSLNPGAPEAAAALERAADLLLLRSPKRSAELYALAQVKAKANRKPGNPEWILSRWLPAKHTLADALSRVWVLAIAGAVALGLVVVAGRFVVRRLRKVPDAVGA